MRNMSFALTTAQFKARTKTVTRRFGWYFIKPGDVIMGVEKAMGLKAGEKIVQLGAIQVVSVRKEPLNTITQSECILEGFPQYTPADFIEMIIRHYRKKTPDSVINRIEFRYIENET